MHCHNSRITKNLFSIFSKHVSVELSKSLFQIKYSPWNDTFNMVGYTKSVGAICSFVFKWVHTDCYLCIVRKIYR